MAMNIDLQQLADILALAEQAKIDALEIRQGDTHVRIVCRDGEPTTATNNHHTPNCQQPVPIANTQLQPTSDPNADRSSQQTTTDKTNHPNTDTDTAASIISPMVGTFYRQSSPDNPPFIEVGKTVAIGDTLCIIEAMKIMHEVKAERAGTVREILANDGDMVEYDQPLIVLG